jgi:hypothetical protein
MTIVKFSEIAGAQIYYPPNGLKPRKVALEAAFHARLESMFADLWQRCPWGQAQWIGSLGCMVPSTPGHDTGRHDSGEAFDLSDVIWDLPDLRGARGGLLRIAAGDPGPNPLSVPRIDLARYLAVEAVVRMHFQTALDWWFNTAHRDHWHIDCGNGEPTWEGRGNQVRFLQAALRYVWGAEGLAIDGQFGPKTRTALVMSSDVDAADIAQHWQGFLAATAVRGFKL